MQDASEQHAVDQAQPGRHPELVGERRWDGILLGNIDLLGVGLLHMAVEPYIAGFTSRRIRTQPLRH